MGLMSGNPYYAGNGIAEGIDGFLKGWNTMEDRYLARDKHEADLAQQQQLMQLQKAANDRADEETLMKLTEAAQKQQQEARKQQAQTDLLTRVQPRPLVDGNGTPTTLGEGLMPPEFAEQFQGPYANPQQAVQQVNNPAWGETLAALQKQQSVPALPLTAPEIASFGVRMGDNNILEKLIPKDPNERYDKLLATGKYTPESIVAFQNGTGKLEFAEKPVADMYGTANGGDSILIYDKRTGEVKSREKVGANPNTILKIENNNSKPKPSKPLSAANVDDLTTMKSVYDTLQGADSLVSGKKVSTGPAAGRGQSLGAYVGLSSDDFNSTKQALSTAENIMLKLRSGAAVTEPEFNRFKNEYPNVNDPPEVFTRKMKNTLKFTQELIKGKLDAYEESGYKVPRNAMTGGTSNNASKPEASSNKAPKVGKVVNGYMFMGGDPADKRSWGKR